MQHVKGKAFWKTKEFWITVILLAILFACLGFVGSLLYRSYAWNRRMQENRRTIATNLSEKMSDMIDSCLEEDYWGKKGENGLGIIHMNSLEMVFVALDKAAGYGTSIEMSDGHGMFLYGRLDRNRSYFDGTVRWKEMENLSEEESGVCIVNFATGEKMLLKQTLRAFIMGDYFVSCEYGEDPRSSNLLIFFCPPAFY